MRNRPAVKILIPYLLGIALADKFDLSVIYLWVLTAFLMIPLFALYRKRYLTASSVLIVLSFISIGFLRYEAAMIPPYGIQEVLYKDVKVQGTVVKSQKTRNKGSSLIVTGDASLISDPSISMTGKIEIRSWEEVFPQKYGDVVEIEGRLSRPRLPRNPGAFDYRKYLMRQGIFANITLNDISDVQIVGVGGSAFLRWVKGLRRKIEGIADETMPSKENASILKGITLGAREELPEDTYQAFLRVGASHILAVSGLHVGIVALWTFLLCNRIRMLVRLRNKSVAYIPVIIVIFIYACMVGFRVSVVRASILALLTIAATFIQRDRGALTKIDHGEGITRQMPDLLNALSVAALCILLYRPGALWGAAFQLSFSAVASIAYLMPHWERWIGRIRMDKWYLRALYRTLQGMTVSLSAQIGAMAVIAYSFKRVSLAGIIVNPVVIPMVALIIPIAFVSYLTGLIYLPLAKVFAMVNNLLIGVLDHIISFFAARSWAQAPVRILSSFWYVVFYVAIIIFIANISDFIERRKRLGMTQRSSERKRLMIASAAVLAVFIWAAALSYDGHILKVTHLDVGQGDSAFVELPNGDNILIDGGPYSSRFDTGERVIAPFLQHKGVGKLDLIVSTHPHNDHAGGLAYTVDNFPVGEAITGSYGDTTPAFDALRDLMDENGVRYENAQVGVIRRDGALRVEAVSPQTLFTQGDEDSRMNENSVALRVTYKGVSFLFTGDIGKKRERLLIDSGRNIKAAVMEAPHQGSKTSSSWEFLRAVQPFVGVISAGRRNWYGHPSPLILDRYKWLGIKTYRTDRQGAITIITDGRRGWVRPMLSYTEF